MSGHSKVIESLNRFIGKSIPPMPLFCIISDIDPVNLTCYCQPINGDAGITDVRLMASVSVGFLILPKDGSIVGISFINANSAWVSSFSDVDKILLNGDAYGGLPMSPALVTRLNNIENKVNALLTAFNNHTHLYTPSGGLPTPTGPPVPTASVAPPLTPTQLSDIENQTVFQGNGT